MIQYFDSIDSTNTEASRQLDKVFTREGSFRSLHKKIIWTQKQTAGRGRMNRPFFSPESGAYMSFIYCPEISEGETFDPAVFTASAAVAVSRTIEKLYKKTCSIKWVNDIYVGTKKVSGILIEGKLDIKKGNIGALVVGIGVNIFTPEESFPEEIKDRAGSVLQSADEANGITSLNLVEETAGLCFRIYDNPALLKEVMAEYRQRSNLTGKKVKVTPVIEQETGVYEALVTGITDDARLVVQLPDGSKNELSSGEVTLHI